MLNAFLLAIVVVILQKKYKSVSRFILDKWYSFQKTQLVFFTNYKDNYIGLHI